MSGPLGPPEPESVIYHGLCVIREHVQLQVALPWGFDLLCPQTDVEL